MLEVKNLVFHPLDNGVEKSIIEDISFAVEDGEMLPIMDGVDITGYSIAQ